MYGHAGMAAVSAQLQNWLHGDSIPRERLTCLSHDQFRLLGSVVEIPSGYLGVYVQEK